MTFKYHKKKIQTYGFTVIKKAFSKIIVNKIKLEIQKYSKVKMRSTTSNKIIDSKLILNPHNQSEIFCKIIFSEIVEKYCKSFLNDPYYRSIPKNMPNYCLNHSIARSSGEDVLTFHRDDRNPPSSTNFTSYLQFGLAIDHVNEDNGCTVCVPKSHLFETYVKDIRKKKKFNFILSPGDLIIYDGRLWHGAKKNISNNSRWMFFFGFARWHLKQTYDFTKNVDKKILKKLDLKKILKLGFHAITKIIDDIADGAGQRGNLTYAKKQYKRALKGK